MTSSNILAQKTRPQNFLEPMLTRTFYTSPPDHTPRQVLPFSNTTIRSFNWFHGRNRWHNFRQPNPNLKTSYYKNTHPSYSSESKTLKMSHQTLVSSSIDDVESMHTFYKEWMNRQYGLLTELQRSITSPNSDESESRLSELLDRVMSHYTEYYNAKSRVGQDNVFLLMSPTWLTPFERSFLWVGGFKPGLAFQILDRFIEPFTDEQLARIEELKMLTRVEENELSDELARIQETVAIPPIVEMAKRAARAMDGELIELESALGLFRKEMEMLVECAECLRFRTLKRVLSVLDVGQSLRFFMALMRFQVQIRQWGMLQQQEAAPSN